MEERVMMISHNKILNEEKTSGPHIKCKIDKWIARCRAESALGYITWSTRPLTPEEELLPTASYILGD